MSECTRTCSFNHCIALVLHTRIALGGKQAPARLIRKTTTNAFFCNGKSGVIDCGEFKDSIHESLRQRSTTGYSNMAAQAGNTYISGTVRDSIEIPTANLGFAAMTSSKEVSPNDCDNDQQPEIAIWPPNLGG